MKTNIVLIGIVLGFLGLIIWSQNNRSKIATEINKHYSTKEIRK